MTETTGEAKGSAWTVRRLRRRWKPHKEKIAGNGAYEPLLIRLHRCFSWMHRVEQLDDPDAMETHLIFRWIALNALYGRWDEAKREPQRDTAVLPLFLDQVAALDADGRLAETPEAHRKLVMAIFDDEYLSRYYWQEPSFERAKKARKDVFNARTWYFERRYPGIVCRVMQRVYLMRCQLVHGAATHGGQLNRTALRRCSTMLGHLLPTFVLTMIDHGREADWGALCYPPIPRQ